MATRIFFDTKETGGNDPGLIHDQGIPWLKVV